MKLLKEAAQWPGERFAHGEANIRQLEPQSGEIHRCRLDALVSLCAPLLELANCGFVFFSAHGWILSLERADG